MTTTPPTPPSWVDKVRLIDLLTGYRDLDTISKMVLLVRIRRYLKDQEWDVTIDEVRTIHDIDDLKILIGAGAPGRVYYAVMAQMAHLSGMV